MKNTRTSIAAKAVTISAVALLATGTPNAANAAQIPVNDTTISNFAVDTSRDPGQDRRVHPADYIGISFDYTFPEGTQPGDTFEIALSDGWTPRVGTVSMTNAAGEVIATLRLAGDDAQSRARLVITAGENIANYKDVSGKINFDATLNRWSLADPTPINEVLTVPLDVEINGTTFNGGDFTVSEVRPYTESASTSLYVKPDTQQVAVHTIGIAKPSPDGSVTYTFLAGDNYKYNPNKLDISIITDQDNAIQEPGGNGKYVWEFPGHQDYEVLDATPDKVVIKVNNIPDNHWTYVQVSAEGFLDGNPYTTNVHVDSQTSNADYTNTRQPPTAGGGADGTQIVRDYTTEVYVATKEADDVAGAHQVTATKDEAVMADFALRVTNTGNVPLVNPTVTFGDFSKTFFETAIPVGGTVLLDMGQRELPTGTDTIDWEVNVNNVIKTDPTVTIVKRYPVAQPDNFVTDYNTPITIVPNENDDEGTTIKSLVDPKTGTPTDNVTVPGEGVWTLNPNGSVTFTPEDGFEGPVTPIQYIPTRDGLDGGPVDITGTVNPSPIGDVIVKFVDGNGQEIAPQVVVSDDAKVGAAYDATGAKKDVIDNGDGTRYVLTKTTGAETGKVVEGDTVITHQYTKVGSWVPTIPGVDLPKIPYPFDPANPGVPPTGVIPHVPGYVPVDPNTGEPLKPVDPEDPTKGYIAPKPGNPGENTVISYKSLGDVIVKFVDTKGQEIAPSVTLEDDALEGTAYDASGQKKAEIPGKDGIRYVLLATPENVKGEVVKGETVVTFTYQKVGSWVPTLPGVDLPALPYPFDPTNPGSPIVPGEGDVIPHVPGYVPVDPNTGEPLQPVDPEDPTKGYIPPTVTTPGENTVINYIPVGTPDTFEGEQGKPVTVVPSGNDGEGVTVGGLVDPKTGEKTNKVTVPGEGTYVLNEDGSVTFTPEDGFTGKTTPIKYVPVKDGVEGKPVDINGFVKPVGAPDTFTTEEGQPVTIVPADNDGKGTKPGSLIDPKTGEKTKEVTVPGEGTYVLNEDGSVVFTPEDGFTGKTTPIQYVPVNEAGDEGEPVEITGEATAKPVVEEPKAEEPKVDEPAAPTPTLEQVVPAPSAPAPAPAAPQQTIVQAPAPAQQAAPAQAKQATAQKAAPSQLAYTGAGVGALAGIGGLLTAAGAFMARRRKG